MTTLERFHAKVRVLADGCWEWTARVDRQGYGHFWNGSKKVLAHRWSFEHFVGRIPEGKTIDHLCHHENCLLGDDCPHRRCVNPDHLEAVSMQENLARGLGKASAALRTGRCQRGHNDWIERPDGSRACRPCRYQNNRRAYLKRRQKRLRAKEAK